MQIHLKNYCSRKNKLPAGYTILSLINLQKTSTPKKDIPVTFASLSLKKSNHENCFLHKRRTGTAWCTDQ